MLNVDDKDITKGKKVILFYFEAYKRAREAFSTRPEESNGRHTKQQLTNDEIRLLDSFP